MSLENLEKMTKKELMEKLEKQMHLKDAVEAKDAEIISLQNKLQANEMTKKELMEKLNNTPNIEQINKEKEMLEQNYKQLEEAYNKIVKCFQKLFFINANYLKQQEASLELFKNLHSEIYNEINEFNKDKGENK